MKKIGGILFLSFCAFLLIGCAPAANTNSNANTNTNTAKPTAAAPTVDSLMAMDKAANEAWAKSDTKWFQDNLSSKFVMYMNGKRMTKDESVKMIGSSKCDVKSQNFSEPAMTKINDDTYLLTYKAEFDGTCTMDGKTDKVPSPVRAATIAIREGDKWMGAFHGENMIIDPKNPPKMDAPKADEKKDEAKTEEKKADDKAAANSNSAANTATAAPAKSANNDALVALHGKGWEAFKNKDTKFFEDTLTSSFVFVDPMGGVHANKADVVKLWTGAGDMKCEGITKTSFVDGVATALSPTVEILTGKGNADGTCNGEKNGDLFNTAVYVKEGEAWKLAFMFESAPWPAS